MLIARGCRFAVLIAAVAALCSLSASASATTKSTAKVNSYQTNGLACPSLSQCTLVDYRGQGGAEVTFDPTAPSTPSAVVLYQAGLTGVACPTTSQCTAISTGPAFTFNPAAPGSPAPTNLGGGGDDIDCPSTSQCSVVMLGNPGEPGHVVTFNPNDPSSQTRTTVNGIGLIHRLSCPTVRQCTVVDDAGGATTLDPTSTAPVTAVKISDLSLHTVSCPSAGQCTATDGDPRGGPAHALTFNPSSPGTPVTNTLPAAAWAIDCPSDAQCTAGGTDSAITFDPRVPGTPKPLELNTGPVSDWIQGLSYVACPTSGQCTGADAGGKEVTFDPVPPPPPKATPKALSLTSKKVATIVGVVPSAKPGDKVTARLTQGAKVRKRATLKVADDTSVTWRLGRLRPGVYLARFVVAGKTVKTTKITVRRR